MTWSTHRFSASLQGWRPHVSWLLTVLIFAASFASTLRTPADTWDQTPTIAQPDHIIIGSALLAAVATALRRRVPVLLPLAAAIGWLSCSMWAALALAAYRAGTTLTGRLTLSAAGAAGTLLAGAPVLVGIDRYTTTAIASLGSVLVSALVVWLPLLLGVVVARNAQLSTERHRLNMVTARERRIRADHAHAEQRARIAREMHDVVAHRVSLMVLHAGALEVTTTDDNVARTAELIRETGRDALTELRHVLAVLRADPDGRNDGVAAPPWTLTALDGLLAEFRAAGLAVGLHAEGAHAGVPATVSRTAYRVVQEGLTNVAKHAGPVPASVTVRATADAVQVIVDNEPGVGPRTAAPPGGHGLLGLRERVELLDGTLHTDHRSDGGFTLRASMPLTAA